MDKESLANQKDWATTLCANSCDDAGTPLVDKENEKSVFSNSCEDTGALVLDPEIGNSFLSHKSGFDFNLRAFDELHFNQVF